tara:strand:+ start:540 stop:737 length:198 start_codon:yes stop_codon:yes gene_type:complete
MIEHFDLETLPQMTDEELMAVTSSADVNIALLHEQIQRLKDKVGQFAIIRGKAQKERAMRNGTLR